MVGGGGKMGIEMVLETSTEGYKVFAALTETLSLSAGFGAQVNFIQVN